MTLAPRITINMTDDRWVQTLKARFKKAEHPSMQEFREEAMTILKDTALEKIEHQYVGNEVGGYYEGLDYEVTKEGFDLVARSQFAQAVEYGTPKTTGHPLVFRGKYPGPRGRDAQHRAEHGFTDKAIAEMAGVDSEKVGPPAKRESKAAQISRLLRARRLENKIVSRDAQTHGELMKIVKLADKHLQADLAEGEKGIHVVFTPSPEANYQAAKALVKKGLLKTKYKFGIYTVFAEYVKGYEGKHVLRDAGKKIAKRAKDYLRKQTTAILTGNRSGGYNIGFGE